MNRVVGDALLNRRTDERWSVTCVELPGGLALLQRTGPMTRVIVSDSANTFAGPDDPDAYSAAVCTPDGELAVVVRNSPPAIVVGPTGCRTRPAEGAGRDCVRLDPGERLLLLSAAAFESLPPVLADSLTSAPDALARRDPEDLLLEIFREVGRGAGAAIDRLAPPDAGWPQEPASRARRPGVYVAGRQGRPVHALDPGPAQLRAAVDQQTQRLELRIAAYPALSVPG